MSQQMSTTVSSSSPNQSENEGSMLAETTQQLNCSVAEDEYVSCQICFMNFNEKERLPKFLACHHIFCFVCIMVSY